MLIAAVLASAGSAGAAVQTPLPQLLPLPPLAPTPTTLAPQPPPINPGYTTAPPDGLSPLLTTPGPVYQLPRQPSPAYPAPQLPGPVDQQKLQAYRNDLRAQQWQLQSQGLLSNTAPGREILQQLNAPDTQ
ncbi:MAG: hypothetical protein JO081_16210 [Alphaproteobacteria bacterium]|nr:hypothetical protein [Alphaproteobacteria bacterium]